MSVFVGMVFSSRQALYCAVTSQGDKEAPIPSISLAFELVNDYFGPGHNACLDVHGVLLAAVFVDDHLGSGLDAGLCAHGVLLAAFTAGF